MSDKIHIVCLDAPSPPDYGGAIDMYYTIVALAAEGKKIILHYFDYKEERNADGLAAYCEEIHAYPRKSFLRAVSILPYIVSSRINHRLIRRLNQDEFPVLLEGIHTSGIIAYLNNQDRVVVRMHNNEAAYYKNLAATEKNIFRKIYYQAETASLRKYNARLPKNMPMACLSYTDVEDLKQQFEFTNLHFIPCFIPWQALYQKDGRGDYCLYHGNMSISENEAAANWIIENICPAINMKLIIAGKKISRSLKEKVASINNVELVSDPLTEEMTQLIRNAQVHLLPSMNTTGVKLKLLHALFEGRFCITNATGAKGIGTGEGFSLAETPDEWIAAIKMLSERDFSEEDNKNRQQLLTVYNNLENARRLSALC